LTVVKSVLYMIDSVYKLYDSTVDVWCIVNTSPYFN